MCLGGGPVVRVKLKKGRGVIEVWSFTKLKTKWRLGSYRNRILNREIDFGHAEFISPVDKSGVIPLFFDVCASEKLPGNLKQIPALYFPLHECIS